ncbi:MAG: OsmC family protein [Smithella sp.]
MADKDKDIPEDSLKKYKKTIDKPAKATLAWDKDLIFTGSTSQGYEIQFVSEASEKGCKPMDALLLSLAGCMGIDIINILTKMRTIPARFRIEIEGNRNPNPPQYYTAVTIVLFIAGNIDTKKLERAIALSRDKYCSVYNSLRPDMSLDIRYVIEDN